MHIKQLKLMFLNPHMANSSYLKLCIRFVAMTLYLYLPETQLRDHSLYD